MKVSILVLICIIISTNSFSQKNPYRLLEKAEKQVQRNKFKKAKNYIFKALDSKYCTCGNCQFEIEEKAFLLLYDINFELEKYEVSRQYLDSIVFSGPKVDSLKILSYQSQYGKEKISSEIDSALEKSKMKCDFSEYTVSIPIFENYEMNFKIPFGEVNQYLDEDEKLRIKEWVVKFKRSSAYALIKGESS